MATVGHSGMLPGEGGVTDFNLERLSPRSLLIELSHRYMYVHRRTWMLPAHTRARVQTGDTADRGESGPFPWAGDGTSPV